MTTNKKVLLGLSGGVDSTAAALLLQEKGYEVSGLFFDVSGEKGAEAEAAERAAALLGIGFIYLDVSREFNEKIIRYFCESYRKGITPNPCVFCNPTVKFRVLAETADRLDIPYVATGHYARICFDPEDRRYYIHKACNIKKDQSYMLYRLGQNILRRLLLPIGEAASKSELREYVKQKGVSNSEKKDSQEICFIKGLEYPEFLKNRGCETEKGKFLDLEGREIGEHKGIMQYTIGQRKNLGQTFGKPKYVIRIDPAANSVVLGDESDLYKAVLYAENASFPVFPEGCGSLPEAYKNRRLQVKIRYAAPPAAAVLSEEEQGDGVLRVAFEAPQRAPAPGQSVVFYDEDRLLGGAVIRA